MKTAMIMAAGTGGHIFPGLAIAQSLVQSGWSVSWLGTATGMEQGIIPKHDIPMDSISFTGLRGKGVVHAVKGTVKMIKGIVDCVRYIRNRRPDVIVGMGGYATVPGGLVAKAFGIPLVLVNADSTLLLSNKILMPIAEKTCFGFDPSPSINLKNIEITGNPVRKEISELPPPYMRYGSRKGASRVLVIGGSLGAKVLNEIVPKAILSISADLRPEITHQTGKGNKGAVIEAYKAAGVKANVVEFIEDMPAQYKNADVVICRAGAITISELTTAGVASVLVPLVASTTNHQVDNANWLASKGGAIHLPQNELSADVLSSILVRHSRQHWAAMALEAHKLRRASAAKKIVDVLHAVTG